MNQHPTNFESVRKCCMAREVDLALSSSPPQFTLHLRGHYNGYGDFFSILAEDVEYLDLAGGITVGDLLMMESVRDLAPLAAKWVFIRVKYSGPALVIRSADSGSWEDVRPQDLFVVVAGTFAFREGADFERATARTDE